MTLALALLWSEQYEAVREVPAQAVVSGSLVPLIECVSVSGTLVCSRPRCVKEKWDTPEQRPRWSEGCRALH